MDFIEDTEYTITGKLVADNLSGSRNDIKAVIHMSGSGFAMSPDNQNYGYGRAVGKVEFDGAANKAVSYTHLTMPTICSV